MNGGAAGNAGVGEAATDPLTHKLLNMSLKPRSNYVLGMTQKMEEYEAKEMKVIFVKYAGNLTASLRVRRPFLRRIGSTMIQVVM
jgi:hypothetical protein